MAMNVKLELDLARYGLNDLFTTKGSDQQIGLGDLLEELANGVLGDVASFNGRTGIVISQTGDYTTDQVTEASNLYFTQARVLSTPITGFVSAPGVITAADTLISALGKLDGNNVAQDPGGVANSIQTNNGSGGFYGDANLTYDGIQTILNSVGSMTGYGFAQSFISSSSSEAGISIDNLGAGGASFSLVTTNNSSGIGGGRFSILDVAAVQARLTIDGTGNVGIGTFNPSYKLDVSGTTRSTGSIYANSGLISSVNGGPDLSNNVPGAGLILRGIDGSSNIGELRIVNRAGAWLDGQNTAFLQIRNSFNNMASFEGGTTGNNVPLDRLQFGSAFTTVTDLTYDFAPVPTHLQEFVNSTSGKPIVAIIDVSGSPGNYFEITSNSGPSGNVFKINGNGDLFLGNGNININGVSYHWPSTPPGENTVLKSDSSGNLSWSVSDSIIETLVTTDDTAEVIFTLSLPDESVYYLEAIITARYADGSVAEGFHKNVTIRAEVSASPSIVAPGVTTIYESNGNVLEADWVINGSSVELQVTGDPTKNVNWKAFVYVYPQSN